MTQKIKEKNDAQSANEGEQVVSAGKKTCFVIMPIADMEGYDSGHFTRVYEYLIVPACANAGYEAHRADVVAASNYIIIDILRKIIDSDLVICDLSGRNPNVLYELGVRQAFNLPTVLIKDTKTSRIFDIQGIRCADYNHSLRIDEVRKEQESIRKAIVETASSSNDVNSMIQLLGIKPAQLPAPVELSNDTSVILDAMKDISARLAELEMPRAANPSSRAGKRQISLYDDMGRSSRDNTFTVNDEFVTLGDTLYTGGSEIGKVRSVTDEHITLESPNGGRIMIKVNSPIYKKLTTLPF